jgi:hypothetical protein
MALSKEMKQYIEKKFNERIQTLKNAQYQEIEEEKKKLHIIKETKVDGFRDFIVKFNEELPDGLQLSSNILCYAGVKGRGNYDPFYIDCPQATKKEIESRYASLITKVEKEKELLLIKLSMEKDFDRINDMLNEYGIELG